MDSKISAKSLGVLSRSVVNKSCKREDLDSLYLPQTLKDDCFRNVTSDRTDKPLLSSTVEPCKCCFFPENFRPESFNIPRCKGLSTLDAQLMRSPSLPDLPTDAEWLKMPERETLLQRYLATSPENSEKKILEACLNPLRFDPSTGLGQIHTWIHRFLYYRNRYKWYFVSLVRISTFLEAMKNFDVVVLPYGLVFDDMIIMSNNDSRSLCRMMIVVNSESFNTDNKNFENEFFKSFNESLNECYPIEYFEEFIECVTSLNATLPFCDGKHCIVYNPMLKHAIYWICLLLPNNSLERYVKDDIVTRKLIEIEQTSETNTICVYSPTLLKIENCVLRFEPLHQCIGDPVQNMEKHVIDNKPFVYGYGGKVLNVTETTNLPSNQTFVQWCISRGMNTLLNLNGNGWLNFEYVSDSDSDEEYSDYFNDDYNGSDESGMEI